MSQESATTDSAPGIITVPGHCFFTRLIELPPEVADREADGFVRLTLEGIAPFPANQLAAGWHRFDGSRRVLVFAAYRKIFPESRLKEWETATTVFPDFAPALVLRPAGEKSKLVLWRTADAVTGLLWGAQGQAPSHVLSRRIPDEAAASTDEAFAASFAKRFGISLSLCEVVTWTPAETGALDLGRSGLEIRALARNQASAPQPVTASAATLEAWDVRPTEFLLASRIERRRAEMLWRGVLGLAATLALFLLLEIFLTGLNTWNHKRDGLFDSRRPDVQSVEDSATLAKRLQELTTAQLRPFDKLAVLSEATPDSVYFSRASSQGLDTLVIEAIAKNPGDVPIYEGRLQGLPQVAKAQARNQLFRDNVTTFTLEVSFKGDAILQVTAAEPTPVVTPVEAAPAPVARPDAVVQQPAQQATTPAPSVTPYSQPAATAPSVTPLAPPTSVPPPPPTSVPPPPPASSTEIPVGTIPGPDGLPPPG